MRLDPSPEIRVPAEWEPQAAVWLAWPHNRDTWPGRFEKMPAFYRDWVRLIAQSTPVRILAAGDAWKVAQSMVGAIDQVEIIDCPTNDCWIRDFGPTFVSRQDDGSIEGIDWRYNAWGGKYPPWDDDQAAAPLICEYAKLPCRTSTLCLEGGAMEIDGRGRLLTTPSCLLTETRNPGWSVDEISQELHRRIGVREIVWLDGGGLVGDDTDGHIDQLARFVNATNVVAAVCEDIDDPNHLPLEENYRQLHLWGDATQPRVEIHRLPIPPARFTDGQRVPESYCNFLMLGKDRLLVPTFAAPSDDRAVGLLRELSGADLTRVDCQDLVWGLGALHCASRDQPAG